MISATLSESAVTGTTTAVSVDLTTGFTETSSQVSPATFDEHEGDTLIEHRFVNGLSPSCPSR